jgi:hypothetical protein
VQDLLFRAKDLFVKAKVAAATHLSHLHRLARTWRTSGDAPV